MPFKCPDESPEEILNLFDGLYLKVRVFYLLETALDLNLFDYLTEYKDVEEISKILNIDQILAEYMLKTLLNLGLVKETRKDNNIIYKNTKIADIYLKKNSEFSLISSLYYYFENGEKWKNLKFNLENREKDFSKNVGSFFPDVVKRMANECMCWELPKVVEYLSKYKEFNNAKNLLDLAGGHGLYAIGFSMVYENLKCKVFDLPDVIKVTEEFIQKYNMKNVSTISGNFYTDDIGKDYDIIFTSYNPGGKNPKLAEKIYNSLNIGGLFINKQFFPECMEDIKDCLNNIEWNIFRAKGLKKDKIQYTFKGDLKFNKYIAYLKKLGFEILEVISVPELLEYKNNNPTKIIVAKKI